MSRSEDAATRWPAGPIVSRCTRCEPEAFTAGEAGSWVRCARHNAEVDARAEQRRAEQTAQRDRDDAVRRLRGRLLGSETAKVLTQERAEELLRIIKPAGRLDHARERLAEELNVRLGR